MGWASPQWLSWNRAHSREVASVVLIRSELQKNLRAPTILTKSPHHRYVNLEPGPEVAARRLPPRPHPHDHDRPQTKPPPGPIRAPGQLPGVGRGCVASSMKWNEMEWNGIQTRAAANDGSFAFPCSCTEIPLLGFARSIGLFH